MKKMLLYFVLSCTVVTASAQSVELYDVIKKLLNDSTGYENIGDWAVGNPKKYPVKWKADRLEMSPDTSINFFRMGVADITVRGKTFMQAGSAIKWNIMLKGPRSGYGSFSILSSDSKDIKPKYTIDSLFGKRSFKSKLLKSCDAKDASGFYYYEVKLPKKDMAFIKISWLSINSNTAIRIDCYDAYSKYAAKLNCL